MLLNVVGAPGTGKTTAIAVLAKRIRCAVFAVDDYRTKHGRQAWTAMSQAILRHRGLAVVESSGLAKELKQLEGEALQQGRPFWSALLLAPASLCLRRHRGRPRLKAGWISGYEDMIRDCVAKLPSLWSEAKHVSAVPPAHVVGGQLHRWAQSLL